MTLSWHNDSTTLQTILQGMGDQHIDVAIRRAETKFQVGVLLQGTQGSLTRKPSPNRLPRCIGTRNRPAVQANSAKFI
jgi:hypothetical protein